jgi:hypothetical protein
MRGLLKRVNLKVVDKSDIEFVKLSLELIFVILSEEKRVFLVSEDFSNIKGVELWVEKLKLKFIEIKSLKSVGKENNVDNEAGLKLKREVVKELINTPILDSMFENQAVFNAVWFEKVVIEVILFSKLTANKDACSVKFVAGCIR